MDLEITGRSTQVTVRLRAQAEEGLIRIQKILGPKCVAKIVLACEKNRCEVEVTVRNTISTFSSRTSAKEVEIALKDALEKVEQQAVKARKRVVTTRHHPHTDATGSIRMQTTDAGEVNALKSHHGEARPAKTGLGKALAAIDDGETFDEQDEAAA